MQKQDWHHKGSSCCSPLDTCCLSVWCPCILHGRTQHQLTHGATREYSHCNRSCAAFAALACVGFAWLLPLVTRGRVRAKYHLEGSGCTDCLCACCCAPCDLVQQDKEVRYREEQGRLLDQPRKAGGMEYAPQWQEARCHG